MHLKEKLELLTFLAFIFVLGIAIIFHEFGHFLTAKLSGIKVFRFSIGFGPKIAGFFWKGTEYVLCLFPFGGYVKMAGEDVREDENKNIETSKEEQVPDKQRFDKKPLIIRALVIFNGPVMNIILAILLLVVVFFYTGEAQVSNIVSDVEDNSPAAIAGIEGGDKIIAINSVEINNPEQITNIINENKGKPIIIKLMRKNETFEIEVIPEYNNEYDRAMIGIVLEVGTKKLTMLGSVKKAIIMVGEIIGLIGKGFSDIITGKMPVELAGPLGIAKMAGEAAKIGFLNLLFFASIINIFLGIINLFPIPILDGGQIALLLIEKVRGRPLKPEQINFLYIIGLALIIMIFLIATYQDILRIFEK